jgi:nucleotide-binding universal stress UspA family protein
MKKLLVPCDFSTTSLNAFQFALDVAAHSPNGTVHLLHVIELPVLNDSILVPVLTYEQDLMEDLREKAEKEFDIVLKKYNKNAIHVITEVKFGKISYMIQQYSKDQAIDAIIMGSNGAAGMREFFIGSNAEKVVRHATVPVLVMKGTYKGPIKHIVFPNTLETEDQEDLVMKVKALQDFFKAHLHIVWINTPLNFTSDSVTYNRLEQFAKRFQFKNYTISAYSHVDAEQGIIEFARKADASLIAMGTHSRKGFAHLIHGSLTESLINHTDMLVWSYTLKGEPVTA